MRESAEYLQAAIDALQREIAALEGFPERQAPLKAQLEDKARELERLRTAPVVGEVRADRDVNIATQQTITTYGGAGSDTYIATEITLTQYLGFDLQTRRHHLSAYVAALVALAAQSRTEIPAATAAPSGNQSATDELRRMFARELLDWELPAPTGATPADDWLRRRATAALLMPLIRDSRILQRKGYADAFESLASRNLLTLMLALGEEVRAQGYHAALLQRVQDVLTKYLADPRFAPGSANLLADLADPQRGLPRVAEVYDGLTKEHKEHLPPGLILLAIGALTTTAVIGGATGAVLTLLITEQRRTPGEDTVISPAPPVPAQPPMPHEPLTHFGNWRIPVAPAEWQAELEQRNEHFGKPAGYWCYVRSGTYLIGGWERGEPEAQLRLERYWIARVPITVAQYAAFIAAGGYRERRWWTPEGWKWSREQKRSEPYQWQDAPFNSRPQQAVQGVVWYEAMAFCAWLRDQVRLPMDYTVRLPTEAEWEAAAACGPKGERRTYPWGDQPPTSRLAVFDQDWRQGAPDVGTCPAGTAACGALDMAGTIWELALSSFTGYPQQAHRPVKDFTPGPSDVPWRGGAYWSKETSVRCGARLRYHPGVGLILNLYDGFRIVVAPALA
jgi:formylglycine-generating enzyme required for sulfatase activity